ncbi:MAG: cyclic nucleotide-binding domain-containing protein, partial [Candidatus Omnitrophica bacterium]|nr:cyclic nucleotide-binding domain-containing protein [Candidatus Omnitrophota bacterium]
MEWGNRDSILRELHLFSGLSNAESRIIRDRCQVVEYKKGQVIYEEGSPASSFYCIIIGRVVVYTRGASGNKTILEYLHRGKYFGIISLLTGETHSVSAQALNDCLLLVIKKEDFEYVLKRIPQLAIDLSQTLSRRLKNKDLHQKTIFESTVISIFSSYSQAGKTIYALNLALSLHKETHKSVLVMDICLKDSRHSLPVKLEVSGDYPVFDLSSGPADTVGILGEVVLKDKFGIDLLCLSYKEEDNHCVKRLIEVLSILVNNYHYIILDMPSSMDRFVFEILNQSELIHILTGPAQVYLERTRNLIRRLNADFHFSPQKIKVIVNEHKLSQLSHQQRLEILGHGIFATLPKVELGSLDRLVLDNPDSSYAKAVRRISRELGDCLVGLALGVGVAYGFCHIGVLKVIEEEKIPIDVITGSSIGALVASLWAIGLSSAEILELTGEFKEPKHLWGMVDLTLPFLGFIKGNKLYGFLKRHLGNKTFYDVRLPLKIIASDIRRKEPRVLDKGSLADAIMASCSMPGVFQPFKFKEEMLLDGGMISPLPTEPLFHMGVRKIIAVNVTPSKEDVLRNYERLKEEIDAGSEQPRKRQRSGLKDYIRNKFKTNILDIIFSSVELMQSALVQKEGQLADVILHPDLSG